MNKESWSALVVAVLLVGLLGFFTYINYEQPSFTNEVTTGIVLRHHRGSTGKTAADPYFVVELANGSQVRVRGNGKLPVTYRGPVELVIGKSNATGLARYEFGGSAHNKSLNSTPQSGAN